MNHGSLFSGGGGFDLASEWMGWKNVFHCEINPFCQQILKYYWPEAISYGDIKKTDFSIWRGKIGILTGGFPCQPYSAAGNRKGKEDERHLWPHMLRAIQEIQPAAIVGENVLGLLNWNDGMVFDEVCSELEAEGYYNSITPTGERKVIPVVLPAAGVDAPHQRYRVWFIAYSSSYGYERGGFGEDRPTESQSGREGLQREWIRSNTEGISQQGISSNANSIERREGRMYQTGQQEAERYTGTLDSWKVRGGWKNFPTELPVRPGDDGLSSKLDGITFSKWSQESIKMAGNAIVPQVAYEIFKAITRTLNDKGK